MKIALRQRSRNLTNLLIAFSAFTLVISGLALSSLPASAAPGRKVLYYDEFNGPVNSPWGNGWVPTVAAPHTRDIGISSYNGNTEVVHLNGNGYGVITASRTASGVWESASMNLHMPSGKVLKPGTSIIVRASLPHAEHFTPALWSVAADLPDNPPFPAHIWPDHGEIDTVETVHPGTGQSTVNVPQTATYSDGTYKSQSYAITDGTIVPGFHVYRTDIATNSITVSIDTKVVAVFKPNMMTAKQWAALMNPERFIATLGVGGSWAHDPTADQTQASMVLDYIRIYQ